MTDVRELIQAVEGAGASLRVRGENIVIELASKVPAELRARLKERKAEILRRLELESRLDRLGISIAIDRTTNSALLIFSEADAAAVREVAAVYKPFQGVLSDAQRSELAADLDTFERLLLRKKRTA